MKFTRLLLIIFVVLGGATAWYLLSEEDQGTTLAGWDRDFKVENTDRIHKIFLADRKGETVTLERHSDSWRYNGKWKARPNAMENLLDAVRRVEMKYKPPRAMVEHMVKDLATNGIKVELYDENEELIKAYYVGGATADERGTYMIMEGAEQPYVTHIPSWEGNLRFRYNLKGDDWRDRTIFPIKEDIIKSVSIEYPKQKNQSFRAFKKKGHYEVEPFFDFTPIMDLPLSLWNTEFFFMSIPTLEAEAFENDNPVQDSITQLVPFAIITLTDLNDNQRTVRLFPIMPKKVLDPETGQWKGPTEVERYFAEISNGDFMLVQHRVFRRILWGYKFFFEKEEDTT
jgi:hypothetical protein